MKILIAADSFKDALSSKGVCQAIAQGLSEALPKAEFITFPLADGGEGTVEILQHHLQASKIKIEVKDPIGRTIRASYLLSSDKKTAYVEMAQASGLQLLKGSERNPLNTSTFGTGQLIRHAVLENGVRHILLGIGGSATNDLGIGMAAALGVRFGDREGKKVDPIGKNLSKIQRIEKDGFVLDLNKVKCTVLCDVENPLFGPMGAAYVFAPQKGASAEDVTLLDQGLRDFSFLLEKQGKTGLSTTPGAGAAGGLGAGAMAFLDAKLKPGIETILEITGFAEVAKDCQYIFTGEGRIDAQTLDGKLIQGITRKAAEHTVPVIALGGSLDLSPSDIRQLGLQAAFSISDRPMSLQMAIHRTEDLLQKTAFNIGRLLHS